MKFLVAFACVLAVAAAKPGLITSYSSPLITPAGFGYSSVVAGHHLAYSAPIISAPIATVDKTQYHAQDTLGQASYGHAEAFQAHNAVQDAAGNKAGSWSYVAPDGQVISASYVADSLGYRVATNGLPQAPAVVPVAPSETPEVAAARAAHLQEHALVKSRSRRAIAIAPAHHLAYSAATPLVHHSAYSVATPLYNTPVVSTYGHPLSYGYY